MIFHTKSSIETISLGEKIGSLLKPGDILAMTGTLAAGKTTITKGIAKSLGVKDNITSPTFCLVSEYEGEKMPLYHMDVYRLEDGDESIGFNDYFNSDGVSIIEWSELISDILPEERLDIKFKVIDENTRIIKLTPHGSKYEDIINYVI